MIKQKTAEKLVRLAQKEAVKAVKKGNPPFGAVLVDQHGHVMVKAHNLEVSSNDPTAHAEITLLRKAAWKLGRREFKKYILFCNAESCPMCMSACIEANIRTFYYGAPHEPIMDPEIPAAEVAFRSRKEITIYPGIRQEQCVEQIRKARETLQS